MVTRMKSSLTRWFTLALACLLVPTVLAEIYVTEVGYGHVRRVPDTGTLEADEGSIGSGRWVDVEVEFIDTTRRIPAILTHGLSTGVLIEGVPRGENAFRLEVQHPTFNFPDGRVTESHTEALTLTNDGDGCYFTFTYFFDMEFERAPGEWLIQLYHKSEMIYQARFTVYQPWDA